MNVTANEKLSFKKKKGGVHRPPRSSVIVSELASCNVFTMVRRPNPTTGEVISHRIRGKGGRKTRWVNRPSIPLSVAEQNYRANEVKWRLIRSQTHSENGEEEKKNLLKHKKKNFLSSCSISKFRVPYMISY